MKIFLDTADVGHIREAASWGVVDGVTTNPSLIARSGRDFKEVVKEICEIVDGPISAEVVSEDAEGMVKEAIGLDKLHKNTVIKIPTTEEGLKAIHALKKKSIKTNATLVFSANQALLVAKAGASYCSPFIGRLDDAGHYGMDLIEDVVEIYGNYGIKTEVIVASVRHPMHVVESAKIGAHIATVPFDVLKKMIKHQLTDIGMKKFLSDWEIAKKAMKK